MMDERTNGGKPDDQLIEAGEVGELKDLGFEEAKHRAETAKSLATWLVIILGLSLAVHYTLTAALAFGGKEEATKNLNTIFNAWLPLTTSTAMNKPQLDRS